MEPFDALSRIRIVLSRTSHPGNLGAAARAMKTMGIGDLALVGPRHFPDPDATAMAAGGADLLDRARVHASLEAALDDCVLAVGFSARRRDLSQPARSLREALPAILGAVPSGTVALVFGNETSGLSNEELARCHVFASIPANPAYTSLNLAAAVQVACYEVAMAAQGFEAPVTRERQGATLGDLEGWFRHLEASAVASGFLDPAKPGRFMEWMRRLYTRARLERGEVKLLRGLLGALDARAKPSPRRAPKPPARAKPAAGGRAAPSRKRSRPPPRKRS